MRTKFISFLLAALLISNISFAKIWRVNNTGGGGGDFTTAQAANDGITIAGDTIHLEPSPNAYGSLNASKRLVWISTGAFLGDHPGEQYAAIAGRITLLNVLTGAELAVFSLYIEGAVSVKVSGARLERCYIGTSLTLEKPCNSGCIIPDNIMILGCYCQSYLNLIDGTNHFIGNNIFGDAANVSASSSAVIQNNVFNAMTTTVAIVSNSTLQNNIFNKAIGAYTFNNCVVQYNMSGSGGVLPAGNFNQNNVAMANVFVNNSGTNDAAFVLKAGSPAIASGAAGADMGAYGGTTPFKIALQPAIPAIYKITAPFTPSGSTMNVTFSTKSNN